MVAEWCTRGNTTGESRAEGMLVGCLWGERG